MKHTWTLLLASLLLVFTLTACGGGDTQTNDPTAGSMVGGTGSTGGTGDGGAANDSGTNGGDANGSGGGTAAGAENGGLTGGANTDGNGGDSLLDEAGDALDDAGRALDGAVSGGAVQQSSRSGAGYSQMLKNARVHDRDGDLTDFENSVTPGSTRF